MTPRIQSLIYMYNHYKKCANECWQLYSDITEAYFMYDHNMEYADKYERELLELLF